MRASLLPQEGTGGADTPVYFTGPLVGVVDVLQVLGGDISQHRHLVPVLFGFPLDGGLCFTQLKSRQLVARMRKGKVLEMQGWLLVLSSSFEASWVVWWGFPFLTSTVSS